MQWYLASFIHPSINEAVMHAACEMYHSSLVSMGPFVRMPAAPRYPHPGKLRCVHCLYHSLYTDAGSQIISIEAEHALSLLL